MSKQYRRLLLSVFLGLVSSTSIASAATLVNGDFEADAASLPNDNNFNTSANSWSTAAGTTGAFNPTEGSGAESFDTGQVGGSIVAFTLVNSSMSQDLSGDNSTLTDGITYNISVRVGSRRDNGGTDYTVALREGTSVLASRTQADSALTSGEFTTVNFSHVANADGGQLNIFLRNDHGSGDLQIAFDDVTVNAVPEPTTYAVISGTLLLLFARFRASRQRQ